LDEEGQERAERTQGDANPPERKRPWYTATWVIPALVVLGVLGGVAIGVGLASDDDSPSFPTPPTLFVEKELPAISDCELEIYGWIDYIVTYRNAGSDTGFQELALEYGTQSEEFRFILDASTQYHRRAVQVGTEQAYQEVAPSIAAFCGMPID
jgi:hypothetical protein